MIPIATDRTTKLQSLARIAFVLTVCLVLVWILSGLLPALLWAVVLAISGWPVRDRLARRLGDTGAAAILTVVVAVVLILPLIALGIQGVREVVIFVKWLRELRENGLGTPTWVAELPLIGSYVATWWQQNLSDPETARALLGRAETLELLNWTRAVGGQFASRLAILGFTLLTLFFLYRDGRTLVRQVLQVGDQLFGPTAHNLAANAGAAIGATVNGLVFVGLGEGVVMGVVYFAVGLEHPLAFTVATAVLAIIPFGAPLVFVTAALLLAAQSHMLAAALVFTFGIAVLFVADHIVRPLLIGNAIQLPFLLVLLGIFGGLETFGLLGLFLGPATMSVFFAIWRQSTAQSDPARSGGIDAAAPSLS
jgi:predicted PurR-regulated permease PerM